MSSLITAVNRSQAFLALCLLTVAQGSKFIVHDSNKMFSHTLQALVYVGLRATAAIKAKKKLNSYFTCMSHKSLALTLATRGRSDFSHVSSGSQELSAFCFCQVISVPACMRSELCTFAFPGRKYQLLSAVDVL